MKQLGTVKIVWINTIKEKEDETDITVQYNIFLSCFYPFLVWDPRISKQSWDSQQYTPGLPEFIVSWANEITHFLVKAAAEQPKTSFSYQKSGLLVRMTQIIDMSQWYVLVHWTTRERRLYHYLFSTGHSGEWHEHFAVMRELYYPHEMNDAHARVFDCISF